MSGELSDQDLRSILSADIRPFFDHKLKQSLSAQRDAPMLVFTGAQPGAGKSRPNERVMTASPGLVAVVGDDLRQFHPDYARLMREDPLAMPGVTAQASGRWIGMSAEYLRSRGADVLIETTLRSPAAMEGTIDSFRRSGYLVELRVLAVPAEVSRLSTVERYTHQVAASGGGRWTPGGAHDEAFARAGGSVEALVSSGRVDRLVIEDRAGVVLFDQRYSSTTEPSGLAEASRLAREKFEGLREATTMSADDGRAWLTQAREQVALVRSQGRYNADLLSTLVQVSSVDARVIAEVAYPGEPQRAEQAAAQVKAEGAWLGRKMNAELIRRGRELAQRPVPHQGSVLPALEPGAPRPGPSLRPDMQSRPSGPRL